MRGQIVDFFRWKIEKQYRETFGPLYHVVARSPQGQTVHLEVTGCELKALKRTHLIYQIKAIG